MEAYKQQMFANLVKFMLIDTEQLDTHCSRHCNIMIVELYGNTFNLLVKAPHSIWTYPEKLQLLDH